MVRDSTAVDEADIRRRKEAVIAQYGPWGCNIHLVGNLFTRQPETVGVVNDRVQRVLQVVADHAGKPLEGLRVLDLAAYEGAFSIELARHGGNVVMVEARDAHIAKARFVKDVLRLDNLEVIQGDVRKISDMQLGTFDVVLCLGILYHLDASDLVPFMTAVYGATAHLLVLETQMSLRAREQLRGPSGTYRGRYFGENVDQLGASIDSTRALWLTKASLMNLLHDVGFTSVSQCMNPAIPAVDAFIDHGTFLAVKGEPQESLTAPEPAIAGWGEMRWPENMKPMNEPRQRLGTLVRERAERVLGKSVYTKLFRLGR